MSLTGKPPQDLAVTNLTVKDTLVATTTTTLNLNALTLNGISTDTQSWNILSVFTNALLGTAVLQNGIMSFSVSGTLNQSGAPLPADSVFAYIDKWPGTNEPNLLNTFVYCPSAPTIATAGFAATITIHTDGTLTINADLQNNDPGNAGRRRKWLTEDFRLR